MTEPIEFETAPRPRLDLLTPERDEHVWIASAVYRMAAETLRDGAGGQLNLDRRKVLAIEIGCWICEEPYSERLSYRKCAGEKRPGA